MSRYIDANMLKDKTTRINHIWNCTTNAEGKGLGEIIDDIPTADVRENVRGEWISIMGHQVCSICGYKNDIVPTNFCPNCGADMRGEENE